MLLPVDPLSKEKLDAEALNEDALLTAPIENENAMDGSNATTCKTGIAKVGKNFYARKKTEKNIQITARLRRKTASQHVGKEDFDPPTGKLRLKNLRKIWK